MLRRIILIVATIAAIIVTIAVGFAVYRTWQSRRSAAELGPATDRAGNRITTTAAAYVYDYALNQIAADTRYKGRWFVIRGTVVVVTRDDEGAALAPLESSDRSGEGRIMLHFRDDSDAEGLLAGHEASLRCVGDGVEGAYLKLRDCTVPR